MLVTLSVKLIKRPYGNPSVQAMKRIWRILYQFLDGAYFISSTSMFLQSCIERKNVVKMKKEVANETSLFGAEEMTTVKN